MEFPGIKRVALCARIRRDSEYYKQGLEVPYDPASKPITFPVAALFPDADMAYPVRMGGNRYRLEDVDFYVVCPDGKLRRLGKGGAS